MHPCTKQRQRIALAAYRALLILHGTLYLLMWRPAPKFAI